MGRSKSGRRRPFSTGRPESLRIIGREHDERSAVHTGRVISPRMGLQAMEWTPPSHGALRSRHFLDRQVGVVSSDEVQRAFHPRPSISGAWAIAESLGSRDAGENCLATRRARHLVEEGLQRIQSAILSGSLSLPGSCCVDATILAKLMQMCLPMLRLTHPFARLHFALGVMRAETFRETLSGSCRNFFQLE